MNRCICGSEEFDGFVQPYYRVNEAGESIAVSGEKFGTCRHCGVVRQLDLPFNNMEEYVEYYSKYPPTTREYQAKNWYHDLQLARTRADVYRISPTIEQRMLDVGCGSGAFVCECRARRQHAYGCEIATYAYGPESDFIYRKAFEEIKFPTDEFDLVTCHDVLEHTLDPKRMIAEMFRITKVGGDCIIDFPNFFDKAGEHHWKDAEHIWYFTPDQLHKLVRQLGFEVVRMDKPIPSKVVYYCRKPEQERTTILVPPGIGDSYWSVVKMQSFIAKEKLDIPIVIPVSNKEVKYSGHERSIPFLRMFPFLCVPGTTIAGDPKLQAIWNEAYSRQGRTIFRNILGYDYFLSYNGHLRYGKQLEEIDPQLACNWFPPMFVSLEQEQYQAHCLEKYGRYVAFYFPFYGTYSHWTAEFPVTEVISSVRGITEQTGCTPIFVGAGWDADDESLRHVMANVTGSVNLTNKTTVEQLFGLLKGASAVVGYPSGLTIMAAMFRVPTLIIWNHYYNTQFSWYCVSPEVRNKTYFIDYTYKLRHDRLIAEVKDLLEVGKIETNKFPSQITDRVPPPQLRKAHVQPAKTVFTTKPVPPKPTTKYFNGRNATVLCVLKSGGDYDLGYVEKLRNMVRRNTTLSPRFVCLSNVDTGAVCEWIPLVKDFPGWWSKLELFRENLIDCDHLIYFDLDTVIVNNIDPILQLDVPFAALGGFLPGPTRTSPENFGTGMMVWNRTHDFSFLLKEFDINNLPQGPQRWNNGDQYYIVTSLVDHNIAYRTIQDIAGGICSYKRNCLRGLPHDARVVCFHGRPRPHQALGIKWVRSAWR